MNPGNEAVWQQAAEFVRRRLPFITITVLSGRGSTPQEPGAKALVAASGLIAGTVGGGKIEAKALNYAAELLQQRCHQPELLTWNLRKDVGMTCGGEMTLLFEPYCVNQWEVVIFGAGHVAQALVRILLTLNCRIFCVDQRADWLAKLPDDPQLEKHCLSVPEQFVATMPERSFALLMTQGHSTDTPILKEILEKRQLPFVGVIGSKSKRSTMERELIQLGIDRQRADNFHRPVGLEIGRDSPEEIAISIAAQLLQVRGT